MKRFILAVVILLAGFFLVQYLIRKDKEEKNLSQSLSRYSLPFNLQIASMMDAYYNMTAAFVRWDSAAVGNHISEFRIRIDSVDLSEVRQDSVINHERATGYLANARSDALKMLDGIDLDEKRQLLNSLSSSLFSFLDAIRYDRSKIYLQKCPMAFHDSIAGFWISGGDSIRNPYLGLHHPYYGKGMLTCGGNDRVLDYTKSAGK